MAVMMEDWGGGGLLPVCGIFTRNLFTPIQILTLPLLQ